MSEEGDYCEVVEPSGLEPCESFGEGWLGKPREETMNRTGEKGKKGKVNGGDERER